MADTIKEPEQYHIGTNIYAPNSPFPALVYRGALPQPYSENDTTEFLERYGWERKGTWGLVKIRHYHPNTHECYGIFSGWSELLLGEGKNDTTGGKRVTVVPGDVVVIPAGMAHCSLSGSKDYRYVGVYPPDMARPLNEFGKVALEESDHMFARLDGVGVPQMDPVYGLDGPLVQSWKAAPPRSPIPLERGVRLLTGAWLSLLVAVGVSVALVYRYMGA